MKKLSVIALLLVSVITANAQHQIYPFFDDKGAVRIETQELYEASDTLVSVFHRADDIVWSRVVYRIIDMRYKQNYQLYFPVRSDNAAYRSLFKVILDAVLDNMPIYRKKQDNIEPVFSFDQLVAKADIPRLFSSDFAGTSDIDIATSSDVLINYDSITDIMAPNLFAYESFVRNQLKYLIQEIVFFDKHTSRMYSKIIAIAPLHSDKIINHKETGDYMGAMLESLMFWIPFDELRPYLARQEIIPQSNDKGRITFDEFFTKKLYTSYLMGDSNMYDRMFLNYAKTEEEVKKEQQRVFDELLNFEQDLWEY